jgi:hypothetical protein
MSYKIKRRGRKENDVKVYTLKSMLPQKFRNRKIHVKDGKVYLTKENVKK